MAGASDRTRHTGKEWSQTMKKNIRILFIGNSHTYYNALPRIARDLFASAGINATVTMQTEGGKNLLYHCDRKDVVFNIMHGGYDYVVLQEASSSFDRDNFIEGITKIRENALDHSTAQPVLYMVWARLDKIERHPEISRAYTELAREMGAPLAPAGDVWHKFLRKRNPPELFREDGLHATPLGSYLAASCIFYAISGRSRPLRVIEGGEPHTRLELDLDICRKIQSEACRATKLCNNIE